MPLRPPGSVVCIRRWRGGQGCALGTVGNALNKTRSVAASNSAANERGKMSGGLHTTPRSAQVLPNSGPSASTLSLSFTLRAERTSVRHNAQCYRSKPSSPSVPPLCPMHAPPLTRLLCLCTTSHLAYRLPLHNTTTASNFQQSYRVVVVVVDLRVRAVLRSITTVI